MSNDKTQPLQKQLVKELRKTIKELGKNKPEAFDKAGNEIDEALEFLEKKALKLLKQIVA